MDKSCHRCGRMKASSEFAENDNYCTGCRHLESTKLCSMCGKQKQKNEFYKKLDGQDNYCKSCRIAYSKRYVKEMSAEAKITHSAKRYFRDAGIKRADVPDDIFLKKKRSLELNAFIRGWVKSRK